MVKLVYHTTALGAINLEFDRPVVTVGSAGDNDFVLPHPSVEPHHCQLEFLEESLILHPRAGCPAEEAALLPGVHREYGIGERLQIGEVVLEVQHSTVKTVAVPREALAPAAEAPNDPAGKPFYCPRCQHYLTLETVTRIGLKGRAKHFLCPRCSRPVELTFEFQPPGRGFLAKVRRQLSLVGRWLRR